MGVTLRPYQTKAADDVESAFRGARSVLLQLGCGGGKTPILAELARRRAPRGKSLILAHVSELLSQMSRKLDDAGVPHGMIRPGAPRTDDIVQVASVQTLARRLDSDQAVGYANIFIDESHHAVCNTYQRVIAANPGALVCGVTASPIRLSGEGLASSFERLVVGPSVNTLIGLGHLVPSRVYAPWQPDVRSVPEAAGDYEAAALGRLMCSKGIVGSAVEEYLWHTGGSASGIVFCASIAHAEAVAAEFNAAGVKTVALSGKSRVEERAAGLAALADGSVKLIAAAEIVSEGLDIVGVSCVISLRPTMSLAVWIQQCGRASRPAPGKTHSLVLDLAGNIFRHGHPDRDHDWPAHFAGTKKSKLTSDVPSIARCPECLALFQPQRTCPACGVELVNGSKGPRLLRQADGTLAEISEEQARRMATPLHDLVRNAPSLDFLKALGHERQYKSTWAKATWDRKKWHGPRREPAAPTTADEDFA